MIKEIKRPGQILDYVDTKEHLLELFDYISDLQEKIKNLKIENQEEYNKFNLMAQFRDKALSRNFIYKLRIDKASEYLEYYLIGNTAKAENCQKELCYLLNILEGSDEE